jgi:hypothetical protein
MNSIDAPIPTDEAFVSKVRREIKLANARAKEAWKHRNDKIKQKSKKRNRIYERKPGYAKYTKGNCSGCGRPYDEYTMSCQVCSKRHYNRRKGYAPRIKR